MKTRKTLTRIIAHWLIDCSSEQVITRNFLLVLFVLIMSVVSYAADVVVEKPVYSAGDYWIFVNEKGDTTKVEFLREEEEQYVFSRDGSQVVKDFDFTEKHPGPIIRFPLKKGQSWTYEYTGQSAVSFTKRSPRMVARYEVADYEQITVPAGIFWAFKITVTHESGRAGSGHSVDAATYWYAPDVKQIIKGSEVREPLLMLKEYKIK